MNSFVFVALLALFAGAQAGFLHQPAIYTAPVQIATPILKAEYPTYAVHSPSIGALPYSSGIAYAAPVVKYHAPVYTYAAPIVKYHAAPIVKYHAAPAYYSAHHFRK